MAMSADDPESACRDAEMAPTGAIRHRRAAEMALLFFGTPILLERTISPGKLIPVLWGLALAAWIALRLDPQFDRRKLSTWRGWRNEGWPMTRRLLAGTVLLVTSLWWYRPELLFRFPREKPTAWCLVMLLYPLLSVYPQGLIFRALYQQRYAPVFRSRRLARIVGALVFSFAHLPFGNGWAMGFTLFGGLVFLRTYERTQSLPLSCLEHALYGNLLFTVGWGAYLYHGGTQALLAG